MNYSSTQGLASLGRNGDSMLVHMSPSEVAGLQGLAMAQGGSLTINPDTGLPEAFKIKNLFPYLIGGVFMWYFMLHSGVHATITGVLLAFAIPFGNGGNKSTSYILQHFLHKPVAFLILPIFALANTAIIMSGDWTKIVTENYSLGVALGLVLGKPIGILLLTFLTVKIGWCTLPSDMNWKSVLGVGFLGGIGFTMSIFISLLAFEANVDIINSKIAILIASTIAAITGFLYLKFTLKRE